MGGKPDLKIYRVYIEGIYRHFKKSFLLIDLKSRMEHSTESKNKVQFSFYS